MVFLDIVCSYNHACATDILIVEKWSVLCKLSAALGITYFRCNQYSGFWSIVLVNLFLWTILSMLYFTYLIKWLLTTILYKPVLSHHRFILLNTSLIVNSLIAVRVNSLFYPFCHRLSISCEHMFKSNNMWAVIKKLLVCGYVTYSLKKSCNQKWLFSKFDVFFVIPAFCLCKKITYFYKFDV